MIPSIDGEKLCGKSASTHGKNSQQTMGRRELNALGKKLL